VLVELNPENKAARHELVFAAVSACEHNLRFGDGMYVTHT